MDHTYIDEHDIANRYVQRTLSATQRVEYEAHFVDCTECLDHLDQIEGLRAGLKQVAAEDAAQSAIGLASPRTHVPLWRTPWHRPGLAAAASVLLVSAAVYFAIGRSLARRELRDVRQTAADFQRQQQETQLTAETLRQRLDEAERKLRSATSPPTGKDREAAAIPVFSLVLVRGDTGPSGPPNRISLARSEPWVVLSLELPGTSEFSSYRVTLERDGRTAVWSQDGLRPTTPEVLALAIHSALLAAGDYLVTLNGHTRAGREVAAGRYPFRVVVE